MRNRLRGFGPSLAVIVAVALAVRLVYALVVQAGEPIEGDGRQFHLLGIVLGQEGRYLQPFRFLYQGIAIPTAEKPPLHPALLAVPSALGLTSYTAHLVVGCLTGAATVAVAGLLGRRVAGPGTGLAAAAVAALYPMLIVLDGSMRSESLYALLIALVLLAAYRLVDRPSAGRAALVGALIGLAALARSEALALLLLLAVPAVRLLPPGRRLVPCAAAALGALALAGPWVARNWITFDRPALSTNEGGLLAGANCPAAYYSPLIGTWPCFPRADPRWGTNEAVISSHLRARALRFAADNAERLPAVVAVRVLRVWELYRPRAQAVLESQIADRNLRAHQAGLVAYYGLVVLAAAGAALLRRRGAPLRLLLAPALLVTLVAALSYGSSRFRAAAEVPLVVLAAVALAHAGARLAARRGAGRAAPAASEPPARTAVVT